MNIRLLRNFQSPIQCRKPELSFLLLLLQQRCVGMLDVFDSSRDVRNVFLRRKVLALLSEIRRQIVFDDKPSCNNNYQVEDPKYQRSYVHIERCWDAAPFRVACKAARRTPSPPPQVEERAGERRCSHFFLTPRFTYRANPARPHQTVSSFTVASREAASETFNICALPSMRFMNPLRALPGPS